MKLDEASFMYTQELDCCDSESMGVQQLEVETQDGGGGNYIVIKTARWALDANSIDAFAAELKRVCALIPDESEPA